MLLVGAARAVCFLLKEAVGHVRCVVCVRTSAAPCWLTLPCWGAQLVW